MNRQNQLTEHLTIGDQITLADITALAARGVKTLIRNRPDHEEPGQLTAAQIHAAAQQAGVIFIDQPVSFSTLRPQDGATFGEHIKHAAQPVHAFCRTGRRCVALWALANAKALGTHAVLAQAASVGEDLRGLAPMLSELEAQDG